MKLKDLIWILLIAACILGAALLDCSGIGELINSVDDMPDAVDREVERNTNEMPKVQVIQYKGH